MPYTAKPGTYWIEQDTQGTEDTFTIYAPDGTPIADVFFWDDETTSRERAEAKAKFIVEALNAHYGDTSPVLPEVSVMPESEGPACVCTDPIHF